MKDYPNIIKSKLPKVGTTIFTVMSQLANEQNAINLSQGFPDFESSDELSQLVSDALKKGLNQYAPMAGLMSLREQIAKKTYNLYGVEYSPETEITVTAGATQAIYTAIAAQDPPILPRSVGIGIPCVSSQSRIRVHFKILTLK